MATSSDDELSAVSDSNTVQIRLLPHPTIPQELHVEDTPFEVPQRLRRAGLSELLNSLIRAEQDGHVSDDDDEEESSNSKRIPFDFLIQDEFLRSSLGEYIREHDISTEAVIEVQYTFAISKPQEKHDFQHDDWIASLSSVSLAPSASSSSSSSSALTTSPNILLAGTYDGKLMVLDLNDEKSSIELLSSRRAHTLPLTCIRVPDVLQHNNVIECVTAGKDCTVRIWQITPNRKYNEYTIERLQKFEPRTGTAIESLALEPKAKLGKFLTG